MRSCVIETGTPNHCTLPARFDPAQHNGAPLLGLKGVVVKSHGSADRAAMLQAILEAGDEARKQIPERIQSLIEEYKAEAES